MTTIELENFKKIPRNDLLIYVHQNSQLGNKIYIKEVYERVNRPTYVFCYIIDELIYHNLIICKNYFSIYNNKISLCPIEYENVEINITPLGVDYVENRLFGFNLSKFDIQNPLDDFIFRYPDGRGSFSGSYESLYNISVEEFRKKYINNKPIDNQYIYYLLTGRPYKENKNKKIFISYSHDSKKHKLWVKNLAEKLNEFFEVEYDKNLEISMSPQNYMKSNILGADYVLIIFTPKYYQKVYSKVESGAQYEFSIIKEDLFKTISFGKYIPILKDGNSNISIPKIMKDAIYVDFHEQEEYDEKLNELINKISK